MTAERRPRILILSAYYFPFQGGSETHARAIATYLASHGFDVHVVTKRADRPAPDLETIDGVIVHRVPPAGPRTGGRKWAMLPFAYRAILRLRDQFDLIYCPGYQGIGLAAIAAGRRLGRPIVLRSGNLGVLAGDQWDAPLKRLGISPMIGPVRWLKKRVQRAYMRADAFACNSRENEREAIACGVPREHVHYLPNAVDVDRFRPSAPGEAASIRAAEGWPAAGRLCLYVGRLSLEKGVVELLEAWRAIDRPDWTLVLVGPDMPGPLDAGPAARAFVAESGMQSRVIFYGESSDTARLLRAADAYVQPSHYESFSNALIEAMATALPVVATRVGGMQDVITDGENGVFVPTRNAAALSAALRGLFDDPARAAALGSRARTTVVDQFNQTIVLQQFADLFRSKIVEN